MEKLEEASVGEGAKIEYLTLLEEIAEAFSQVEEELLELGKRDPENYIGSKEELIGLFSLIQERILTRSFKDYIEIYSSEEPDIIPPTFRDFLSRETQNDIENYMGDGKDWEP